MKIKKITYLILVLVLLNGCTKDSPIKNTPTPLPSFTPTVIPTKLPTNTPTLSPELLSENDTDRTSEKIVNTLLSKGWVFETDNSGMNYLAYYENDEDTNPTNISSVYVWVKSIDRMNSFRILQDSQSLIAVKSNDSMEACEYDYTDKQYHEVYMDYDLPGEKPVVECSEEMKIITDEVIEEFNQWLNSFGLIYEDILTLDSSDIWYNIK